MTALGAYALRLCCWPIGVSDVPISVGFFSGVGLWCDRNRQRYLPCLQLVGFPGPRCAHGRAIGEIGEDWAGVAAALALIWDRWQRARGFTLAKVDTPAAMHVSGASSDLRNHPQCG